MEGKGWEVGSIVFLVVCLMFCLTYIRKLLRDNDVKEKAIMGLREIIRFLEEKS